MHNTGENSERQENDAGKNGRKAGLTKWSREFLTLQNYIMENNFLKKEEMHNKKFAWIFKLFVQKQTEFHLSIGFLKFPQITSLGEWRITIHFTCIILYLSSGLSTA